MKWFLSDTHLGHKPKFNTLRDVFFESAEEWAETMISGINESMEKHDTLFLLGDFCVDRMPYWRQRIRRGSVWLIHGNHDPGPVACQRVFGSQFRQNFMTKICGNKCWLSHYAHAFWPDSHKGAFHLYGHCHSQREATLDRWMPERRSSEVCPEVIFEITGRWGPISEEEIYDYLKNRRGHDDIEFYKELQRRFNDAHGFTGNT